MDDQRDHLRSDDAPATTGVKELSEMDALRLELLQLKADKAAAHAAMYTAQLRNAINDLAERDGLVAQWHCDIAARKWVKH